jgi:PKD repeat protein
MVKRFCNKVLERFSAHRWAKSRHVLLIALLVSSCFISLKTAFSKKSKLSKTQNKDHHFKRISFFLIGLSFCFICFSIICAGLSSAATVYVGTSSTSGTVNYQCDGTNDHVEINKALAYIDGQGGGTVYLRGPNTYWIDSTLNIGANTILTGDSTAEIKLVASAGWSSEVPMIANIGTDGDITITGFTIDGNSANQAVSLGAGYYNMMLFDGGDNIEVSDMRLEWGCGDGLQVRKASNIKFTNNDVYKLGHDVLYAMGCSNVEFAYNTVFTRTNSACRYSDGCTDSTIHDNLIYASNSGDSTGPAIQIGTSSTTSHVFDDIEIYNNRIHSIKGAGIWMSANYQDNVIHARDVYIHHNIFTNVGQYATNTGFSNAAIVLGDFDNTIIENNVFDDGGHAAIKYFLRSGRRQQQTQFTTYVRNNIIMNSDGVSSVTGSGVGIWNTNPTYSKFVVQNNDIYNNKNGQTYGSGFTMSNNLNVDPSCVDSTNSNAGSRDYHLESKAGHYSSGKWVTDSVSSTLIDAGYSSSSYSKEPSPNGGVVNIGRYGNTAQASKSGSAVSNEIDAEPVANAGSDKSINVGSTVLFSGNSSSDDVGISSYSWDFDVSNGITSEATGVTATKKFTTAGTYTVTLTVTDTSNQTATDTVNVVVSETTSTTTPTNTTTNTSSSTGSSVSYSPTYDNRLRSDSASTVLSTSTYLDVGASSSTARDVMLFDLSDYDTTDTITAATLSLYWYYPASKTRTSDTVVEVYRPVAWDPKYVSWNNRASGTAWSTAGGNWYDKNGAAQGSIPYATLTFPASTVPGNKYYDFDVTQLVQEYVSGTYENTGFFLKAKSESGNYIAFYGAESSNTAMRPKLTITSTSGGSASSGGSTTTDSVPVANAGSDMTATVGSAVSFDGSASTDDAGIASYSWDFNASNGITSEATGATPSYTYTTAGTYTVTLTVTDTSGQTATDTVIVVVSATTSTTTPTDTTPDEATSTGSSVSYSPTYDNRLRSDSKSTVLSTSTYLDVGASSATARDVMLFDLSDYDTTDTITAATLSLYWYYPASKTRTSDTVVEVYRPVAWDPKYVSWNYRASGTAWSTAGGNWYDKNGAAQGSTPYATLTFPASTVPGNKYYDFDVTQLVQQYVSGTYENTGFFLKAKSESGNYIAFYSAESSNTAMRPKLTITSTSGGSTPSGGSTTPDSSTTPDAVPVANAGSDMPATVGSAVSFDGSASTDDVGIASYSWDFNALNGITSEATGATPSYTYTAAGTYTVTLTVTDTAGQTATDTVNVVVSAATSADSVPVANAGLDKTATVGSSVSFDGSSSTDDKGITSYSWDFDSSNGITAEAAGVTAAKTFSTAGTYIVTLTVTDTAGQTATDTVNVVVSATTSTTTNTSTSTGTSVSYSAVYDNRLAESSKSTVYSTSTYLDVGKSSSSSRDVLLFDLSSYKTTDTISKATLSLYWYYPASKTRTSDTVVEVYRPVAWDPKYVSWNNRASGTAWTTAGGNWYDQNGVAQGSAPYATLTFPASTVPGNKYYDFDVTQLVQEYISGKYSNTGFFLKAKTESGNYIAFYSTESSTASRRPKLTITT